MLGACRPIWLGEIRFGLMLVKVTLASSTIIAPNHEGGGRNDPRELAELKEIVSGITTVHTNKLHPSSVTHDAAYHSFGMVVQHCCFAALGSCAIGARAGCESSARDAG